MDDFEQYSDATGDPGVDLGSAGARAIEDVWSQFIQYIPEIVAAIAVLIIGWVAASLIGTLVTRLIAFTGIDAVVTESQLNERLKLPPRSRYRLLSGFVGSVVKWLIIIVALAMASDILNLTQVNEFLGQVIAYVPRVIVAVVILTVGMLAANFVSNLLYGGLEAANLPLPNEKMLAAVSKYAIIIFSVMAALTQLGIVPRLIEIAFAGMVFALALAFGLGGKDHASKWIQDLKQQMP